MQIGPHTLQNQLILAPMAGVTDRPFRSLCRRMGAGMAVAEMVSANPRLLHGRKTLLRTDHRGETGLRAIQILGNDPEEMALAAKFNADRGAHLIDINMGCPAKKVLKKAAGSALMRDEVLVRRILEKVVHSVDIPVTLKMRTGWDLENRNAVTIARMAEDIGIRALTVHGRTRACGFSGSAEYLTIREVKHAVKIPVVANGDITTPEKARLVLEQTGADAVMIGRGALGRPWFFQELIASLTPESAAPALSAGEKRRMMLEHVIAIHDFYGENEGVRIARKHVGWYLDQLPAGSDFKSLFYQQVTAEKQISLIHDALESQGQGGPFGC